MIDDMLYVIAKYKEDISWSDMLPNKIIYDKSDEQKGISLPNTGREAGTYLRYIIDHYDQLPSHVVFLQGNPFDHMEHTNISPSDSCQPYGKNLNTEPVDYYPGLHMREYFSQLFGRPAPQILEVSYGAQYIVPRECILRHPIEFYKKLQVMLKDDSYDKAHYYNTYDPETLNPWIMERLWYYIFS